MKLCFIADSNSIHVHRIIAYFVREGHEVFVISTAAQKSDLPNVTMVYALSTLMASSWKGRAHFHTSHRSRMRYYISSLWSVNQRFLARRLLHMARLFRCRKHCSRKIKEFAPDVVVVIRAFPEGLFARWCYVRYFVLRTAGSDISYFTKIPFLGNFIRSTIRRAGYIITQSEPEKTYLQQELGVRCPIGITNIGVDVALFKPTDHSNRAKYGLCQNTVVVVSNRYFGGVYNGFAIIEAFLLARKRCANLELLYISPSPIMEAMRNKIESISRGVDGIHIVEGPIPHEEMAQALGCGDIWASLSSVDGVPNSLLEAMSCGLVPIVGELQPLREWVQQGSTGFLVPPRDVAAMADMMVRLGENKVLLKELSHHCRQKICQDGSYEKNMRNMMDMALTARNS